MTSQPRAVWLTREQRDRYADYLAAQAIYTSFAQQEMDAIVAAWDAAPTNPAEAVYRVALSFNTEDADEDATPAQREVADMLAEAVLGALGGFAPTPPGNPNA